MHSLCIDKGLKASLTQYQGTHMLTKPYLTDKTYSQFEIKNIQRALNENTYLIPDRVALELTGEMDEPTQKLLQDFQEYRRFEVTGTYTARTSSFLNEFIRNKYITKEERTKIANELGVSELVLTAMACTLSGPFGFGSNGRCVIRFDTKEFYKRYQAKHGKGKAIKLMREHPTLVGPEVESPSDHLETWSFMESVMKLSYDEALESAYYGLGAIPGKAWRALRVRSIYELLGKVQSSEYEQVVLFALEIQANTSGLLSAIKRNDIGSIARHYVDRMPEEKFVEGYRYWLDRIQLLG